MTKKQRAAILAKTGGKCAYCGVDLSNGWNVEHVVPKDRGRGPNSPPVDADSNLVPSCRSCNAYKGPFTAEEFRREIERTPERLERVTAFRFAMRFGLIHKGTSTVRFYREDLLRNWWDELAGRYKPLVGEE